MKAIKIIEVLTQDDYSVQDGVVTVEKNDSIWNAFINTFGKAIEPVYLPLPTSEYVSEKVRHFLYLYDLRFPGTDKDLFAILKNNTDDSIIYIYEIE